MIDLEAKPISYKKFETIFGDTYEYADRYPTPGELANDLSLDTSQFQIEQPIGEHSDFYRITSLISYFQEAVAAEQAQTAWNQSHILHGQMDHVWHEDKTEASSWNGKPWTSHSATH